MSLKGHEHEKVDGGGMGVACSGGEDSTNSYIEIENKELSLF